MNGWTSRVEVRQLRVLLALVDHGSLHRAATALGLAQSTVSEALAALERAVGTRTVLRGRGSRRIALTAAGEALLPHARGVLQQLEAAQHAIASVTREVRARVDVVANESVSTYLLPPALGTLRRQWPNTRFAVSVGTCDTVRADLAGGLGDVGILLEDTATPEPPATAPRGATEAERLVLVPAVPLVVFANAAHPLARHRASSALRRDALAPFPLFLSDAAGELHDMLRRYFAAGRLPGPRLEATGSIERVKRGVSADPSALGILPQYALAEDIRAGRWVGLDVTPAAPRMRLVALLSPTRPAHPAIMRLLEQLRALAVT